MTSFKFDSTFDSFDNRIATEYLRGNTTSPLVAGRNATLNSDRRIFASDGNTTIRELGRSHDGFRTACADMFTRMIDTVPAAVQLTDPIEAVDVKPYVELAPGGNGSSITFSGWVRVRTTDGTGRDAGDLAVHLTYTDRNGEGSVDVPAALDVGGSSYGLWGESFAWYQFEAAVPAASGIGGFLVHMTTPSTGSTAVHRNGDGGHYPLDDALLYQASASCVNRTSVANEHTFTVTAAVLADPLTARASSTADLRWRRSSSRPRARQRAVTSCSRAGRSWRRAGGARASTSSWELEGTRKSASTF